MPPTVEHVRRAIDLMRHGAEFDYFFTNLRSPEWIGPLREAGVFESAPGPRPSGDGVVFPNWAPVRYLARVAKDRPELVMETILGIADNDNPVTRGHMIDAAIAMPADLAARLVPRAKMWVRQPYRWLVPHKLGLLCTHLSEGGFHAPAIALLRALLATTPEEEGERVRPLSLIGDHEYREITTGPGLAVVATAGMDGLAAALDALYAATRIWFSEPAKEWSHLVRPSIAPDEQNHDGGPFDALVDLVRDSAAALIANGVSIGEVLGALRSKEFPVFHRIALHLLSRNPELAPEETRSAVLNAENFYNSGVLHEYTELVRASYAALDQGARSSYLRMIGDGPRDSDMTGDQVDYWRLVRYAVIVDYLADEDRPTYERLESRFGKVDEPYMPFRSRSWRGPTSPRSPAEIADMTVEEIIDYVQTWKAPDGPFDHSEEGLGRAIASAIGDDPTRFAATAVEFLRLPATYGRSVVSGLRDAIRAQRTFSWQPVLQLCESLVSSDESADEARWTRREVGHLIEQGMADGPTQIPDDLWPVAWKVITRLAADSEPDLEHEERYGGGNMDPYTLSINTVRGEAIHAGIAWALAQYRASDREGRPWSPPPEVREFFEQHVDREQDPSPAIHSVFGALLPQIQLLDPAGFEGLTQRLFSNDHALLTRAAWEAFLVFARPYRAVYPHVEHMYLASARSREESPWRWMRSPKEGLVSHLVTYYLIGLVDLQGGSPLRLLLDNASPETKAEVIEHVGRIVRDEEHPLTPGQLALCQALWLDRLGAAERDREGGRAELSRFGWWFSSTQLDPGWVLENALAVLALGVSLDPEFAVFPRLAELAESHPRDAVRVVWETVDLEQETWRVHSEREHIRVIVATAQASNDSLARRVANDVLNQLAARGITLEA